MFFKYWVEFRQMDQIHSSYTHLQVFCWNISTKETWFLIAYTLISPVFSYKENKIIGNLTQRNDFLLKLSFDDGCRPIVPIINN